MNKTLRPTDDEPLGISKLVALIGDDNIKVQNILANATDFKDGKKQATITFTAPPENVQELMQASVMGRKSRVCGLVIWFPTDKLPALRAAGKGGTKEAV